MQKEIAKLKKLGMSDKKAMLFVRNIASRWLDIGRNSSNYQLSLDTLFSKELSKTSK